MSLSTTLSPSEARRVALAAQGFNGRRTTERSGWARLRSVVDRIHLLQIDSVSAIVRSHYLPGFSRIGAYDIAGFERKAFQPKRRELFEYWAHEASLLPFRMHPLLRWRMERAQCKGWINSEVAKFADEQPDFVAAALREVRDRGPIAARELGTGRRKTGMWEWDAAKTAMEYLFWTGAVTTHSRRGSFERIYDLPERVLPAEVLELPTPSEEDAQRELVRLSAKALGVATEPDLRDYFRLPPAASKARVAELVEAGELIPVTVKGWDKDAYLALDAACPARIACAALLSPFDPVVWERDRTERLFGFHYRLEIYTPEHKRRYGYYVLPFLLNGRIVARLDLKSERDAGVLRVCAAHAEPRAKISDIVEPLAGELRHMAEWLCLSSIRVDSRGDLAPTLELAIQQV